MEAVHLEDDKLQSYFDGELSDGETRVARRHVDACAECRGKLRALERLHGMLRDAADDMAGNLDMEALYAGVRAGIDRQRDAGFGERMRVVIGERRDQKRPLWLPVASAALAAAVVLVVFFSGENASPEGARNAAVRLITPPPAGSEVVGVDFGANTGTVFEIESSNGAPVAVVWINDDEEPSGSGSGDGTGTP